MDPVVAGDCNPDVLVAGGGRAGWADNGHRLAQDDGTVGGYRLGQQPGVSGHRLLADDYQVTAGAARRRTPSCSRTGGW